MRARIITATEEKEGVWKLILDETIFYPMGGGQPTDQGYFIFPDGSQGEVYQVLLKDGEINHYVKTTSQPVPGTEIRGNIDWERRYKNMRVHSAGHVIDFSMYLLGYSPAPLYPLKGDHGKKPFILYQGVVEKEIKEALQKQSNALIANAHKFSWKFDLPENIEAEALYLQPGLPKNKPLRALKLDGVGVVADGGTIVASTSEVGNLLITEIEVADGNTCVKYQLAT